jgi:hypothetical protein
MALMMRRRRRGEEKEEEVEKGEYIFICHNILHEYL